MTPAPGSGMVLLPCVSQGLCIASEVYEMRTHVPKPDEINREWLVMDAADQVLGRLASEEHARRLRVDNIEVSMSHLGDHAIASVIFEKLEDR